jgi:hypothetical protein
MLFIIKLKTGKKEITLRLYYCALKVEPYRKYLKHYDFIKPPLFATSMNIMMENLKMEVADLKANSMSLKLKN